MLKLESFFWQQLKKGHIRVGRVLTLESEKVFFYVTTTEKGIYLS